MAQAKMNKKSWIVFAGLMLFIALLFGGAFWAEKSGENERTQNVAAFRAAPQVGNVVEIEEPEKQNGQTMHSYFKITRIEEDNFYGNFSAYSFNSQFVERGLETPGFFNSKETVISKQDLMNEKITNVLFYKK